ncbi:MAG: CHAT domain-containing protein [Deltaproteobacteria bacterium]|nr:CHAT domain-containing protein [Deltaproteobacteria bacterium]
MKCYGCLGLLVVMFALGCASIILPKETVLLGESRYAEMEQLMESRVKNMETASTSDLFHLCLAYSKVKRYDKLFPCLDQFQQNIDEGDNLVFGFDYSAGPSAFRGEAYMELGDYEKAKEETDRAYRLAKTVNAVPEMVVHNLTTAALVRALMGERMAAERLAAELEARAVPPGQVTRVSDKNIGLAKVYMALGDYRRALAAIRRGQIKRRAILAKFVLGQEFFTFWELPTEYIKNKCLLETGEITAAKAGYDQLLQMAQTRQNGDLYWLILSDRARIAVAEGDREKAINLYIAAVEVIEQQRSSINTEASKIGFVGNKQDVYAHLVEQLVEDSRFEEAFEYTERAKARALVDMLASKRDFQGGKSADTTRLNDLLEELEKVEMDSIVEKPEASSQHQAAVRGIMVEIKDKISETNPELASLVTVNPPDLSEIQRLIPPDETLIEYFGTEDKLFAFVVTHEGVQGLKLEATGWEKEINEFRKTLMLRDSKEFKASGQTLYGELIQPLESMIASKNLTIVPHGALHYLPFNALCSNKGFLIDNYTIRVLPSGTVMKFLKGSNEGQAGSILAFGNPNLGNPIYDLPGAEKEAIAITREQPNSKLFTGEQATETSAKRFGKHFRYIHFATHATFDAEKPLTSGLLLAADGENDGMLTVGELYDLRLNADLVTLSACETALGKVANGDDVVGFTRGFLYAGARSIVSSLWKVDDQATSILMQEFYKQLQGKDKREALRTAQMKVKNTYNSHPYFWAAFQITGAVD